MKNRLFWELCVIVAAGSVILFFVVDLLAHHTEQRMSFIAQEHQQELKKYARQAERIFHENGEQDLEQWLSQLQEKEDTWAAVVSSNVSPLAGSTLSVQFVEGYRLGRNVEWKIHLYFKDNPIMDIPFSVGDMHFLIRLPQRMRPGNYFAYADVLLQIVLPFITLCFLSFRFYRHLITPVKKLACAVHDLKKGDFNVRVKDGLGKRNDELATLAGAFDQMAERTGKLFLNQRQLLADLSHEVRTPLTRIDMAIDYAEEGHRPREALARLRYEAGLMRELVENTLTLAWLTSESPRLNEECFDLAELIQVICDDARFEYPDHLLSLKLPISAILNNSSQRALGQAIENIIRNALAHAKVGTHTNSKSVVEVKLSENCHCYRIRIKDNGPGVPEHLLNEIFRPFFRVNSLPNESYTLSPKQGRSKHRGFGLGLSLAQRQVIAVGGEIWAENDCDARAREASGLKIVIELPKNM